MHGLCLRTTFRRTAGRYFTSSLAKTQRTIDPVQEASLRERCLLVDRNDHVIGVASKRDCHQVQRDGTLPLHRAFSVFLFDHKGDLLLQKRSETKITYPNCYTNTCCSHPIGDIPGEQDETNAIGVIRAAQRRLNHELGIQIRDVPVEKFKYLTRIYYQDKGDGIWGEHEIDYILFLQADVELNPNPNEISEINFVSRHNIDSVLAKLNAPLTPWFEMILKHKLQEWWANLHDLEQFRDHKCITELEK